MLVAYFMARVDEKVNRTTRSGQYVVYIYVIFRLFEIYLPCIELPTDLGHSRREMNGLDEITRARGALANGRLSPTLRLW